MLEKCLLSSIFGPVPHPQITNKNYLMVRIDTFGYNKSLAPITVGQGIV